MNRLEKFRQKRNLKQKYMSAALLFLSLLIAGIMSVDYSINYLVSGRQGFAFATVNSKDNGLEIVFMNQRIYVNTQYIKRDLNKLKSELQGLLIFRS